MSDSRSKTTLSEMRSRLKEIEGLSDRLEKSKDQISADTFRQLSEKYSQGTSTLRQQIAELASAADKEFVELRLRLDELSSSRTRLSKQLQELETLRTTGSIDETYYRDTKRATQKEISTAEREHLTLSARRASIISMLVDEQSHAKTRRRTSAPKSPSSPGSFIAKLVSANRRRVALLRRWPWRIVAIVIGACLVVSVALFLVVPRISGGGVTEYRGGSVRTGISRSRSIVPPLALAWKAKAGHAIESTASAAGLTVYVGSTEGTLRAFKTATGALKWSFQTGSAIYGTPAVAAGTVFIGSNDDYLYALDSATGFMKWRFKTGRPIESSPVVVDGIVYVGSLDGNVYAVGAQSGHKKWVFNTQAPIVSSPAVRDGVLYVGSEASRLFAIDTTTGRELWNLRTDSKIYSTPAVDGGSVFVADSRGSVYRVNAHNGKLQWQARVGATYGTSATVAGGNVYIANAEGKLVCLSEVDGSEKWSRAASIAQGTFGVPPSITYSAGLLYLVDGGGRVHALNATNGDSKWTFPLASSSFSTPELSSGTLYLGGQDGFLYAVRHK